MSRTIRTFDNSTGEEIISSVTLESIASGIQAEEYFVVTPTNGETTFQLVTNINSTQRIHVVAGILMREGASYDYQRDDVNNRIIFNYAVPRGTKLTVTIYN